MGTLQEQNGLEKKSPLPTQDGKERAADEVPLGRRLKKMLDLAGESITPLPQDKYPEEKSSLYRGAKRVFDIAFSFCVLVVFFVPGIIISLLIWRETKACPIYTQERMTYHGRSFRIVKFRSMVADSDNVEKYFTPAQLLVWRRERKVENDPRITKFGRFIRATSIDELPQFWNVLVGDMSVVGPRAITREELEWFGTNKGLLLSVKAGMTGLWQTSSRNNATFVTGERQALELEYVRKAGFWFDLMIVFKTIAVVLKRTGK